MIFILFTVFINIIVADINLGVLIGIRLILVCNITYTFSRVLSYTQFANAIEHLSYPLKIFNIKPKDVGLLVCMAIAFIPIFKDELQQIKNALYIKGTKKIKYILQIFFISVFKRINDLEMSLKSKAYEE